MILPYYAIEFYLTNEEDFQKIKLNEDFRIERTRQNVLSMPRVYFYQRKLGIFEKNICRPAYDKIVEEILDISTDKLAEFLSHNSRNQLGKIRLHRSRRQPKHLLVLILQ